MNLELIYQDFRKKRILNIDQFDESVADHLNEYILKRSYWMNLRIKF